MSTASFPIAKSCDAVSPAKGEVSSNEAAAVAADEDDLGGAADDAEELLDDPPSFFASAPDTFGGLTSVAVEPDDDGGMGGLVGPADMTNFLARWS